ncbi:hypothetical protein ACFQ3B_02700 [Stackebrandtia endophytica]|uniref:hypothetical protein n=1 Tax=Stackebrandtia endophytica TaxID=1496996 RepID=UPI00147688BF|nr:hypothetical protein [Stackebrandtia endophytica]
MATVLGRYRAGRVLTVGRLTRLRRTPVGLPGVVGASVWLTWLLELLGRWIRRPVATDDEYDDTDDHGDDDSPKTQ